MSLNKYSRKNNPLKPQRNFKDYIKFLGIALLILFVIDFIILKGERPYITKMKQDYWAEQDLKNKALEEALPPKVIFPETGEEYFEAPELNLKNQQSLLPEKQFNITKLAPEKIDKPDPTTKLPKGKKAKIVIVIDDVGMNIPQSRAAIRLPSEVTLALLPYASGVREMAKKGKAKGHELIIHTPMEAMSKDVPIGSMALYTDMDKAALQAEFNKIAASFDGYVGINNHMGSKLTQDSEAMKTLMVELKNRGLFFLDSKTISTSLAAKIAQKNGVPSATRDVFLDHEDTPEFLTKALKKVEAIAREHGSAIAIGHPKQVTITALRKWIPTLESRGFELVPLSALIDGATTKKPTTKTAKIKAVTKQQRPKKKKEPVKLNFESPVGPLTMEDEQVIINPLDDNVVEMPVTTAQKPKKEIEIMKVYKYTPTVSYPVD